MTIRNLLISGLRRTADRMEKVDAEPAWIADWTPKFLSPENFPELKPYFDRAAAAKAIYGESLK